MSSNCSLTCMSNPARAHTHTQRILTRTRTHTHNALTRTRTHTHRILTRTRTHTAYSHVPIYHKHTRRDARRKHSTHSNTFVLKWVHTHTRLLYQQGTVGFQKIQKHKFSFKGRHCCMDLFIKCGKDYILSSIRHVTKPDSVSEMFPAISLCRGI